MRRLPKKSKCLSLRAWASVNLCDCVTVCQGDCAFVSLEFVPLCLWSLCYRDSGSLNYCDSGSFGYCYSGRLGNRDSGSLDYCDSWRLGKCDSGSLGYSDSGVWAIVCTLGVGLQQHPGVICESLLVLSRIVFFGT